MSRSAVTLIGTRPEIIKMSAVIPLLDQRFTHRLVHSGQHYSFEMDAIFFDELDLRRPDTQLSVGSMAPAAQIGAIATRFEQVVLDTKPDTIIVHGDTNTALAGALVAAKYRHNGLKLVHVEAGTRSGISHQPEEVNRLLVDRVSDLLLVPYEPDREALAREGIVGDDVVTVGSTVFDSCLRTAELVDGVKIEGEYALATFHRQETVDDRRTLAGVVEAIRVTAELVPVYVPLHPRTRKRLSEFDLSLEHPGVTLGEPIGYRDFVALLKHARFCITDSGGIQEEAALLRIPTVVIREKTEHRRYVEAGMHVLTGTDPGRIAKETIALASDRALLDTRRNAKIELDTGAAKRVVTAIERFLARE